MSTPIKMSPQGSPAGLKESPSSPFPSSSRISDGSSTSPSEHHQSVTKPIWAPLETDAPITLASRGDDEVHVCQLCGCWYETRKGLSSHARAHLRQIGIPDCDIKGGPIEFLYKFMKEQDLKPITRPEVEAINAHSSSRPSMKNPSDLSPPRGATGSRSSTPIESPPSKRARASEDCRCVLCGEVFENRKGLASHSRSHLRDLGVTDLLGKASAIDTLEELVSSGVLPGVNSFKTRNGSAGALSSRASSSPAPPLSPSAAPVPSRSPFPSPALSASPTKCTQSPASLMNRAPKAKKGFRLAVDPLHRKPKPEPVEINVSDLSPQGGSSSSLHTAPEHLIAVSSTDVQAPPTVLCDFCGQLFDTRKALSCHVRAHLRQLGLTWSINTSPIDLLNQYLKYGEKVKTDSVFCAASVSGKATTAAQGSKPCNSPLDYSLKEQPLSGKSGITQNVILDTSCELCGFHFENRKALASHARAHLRQLGAHEWKMEGGTNSPIEFLSAWIRRDPSKVAEVTRRYRMGDLYIKKAHRTTIPSPSLSTDSDSVPGSSLKPLWQQADHRASREDQSVTQGSSRATQGHNRTKTARGDIDSRSPRVSGHHSSKHLVPRREDSHQPRSGSIPAMLPKPPLTPLVKLVGKVYSLKCRFCEEVFEGPLSIQEKWITHLQKHILDLGYKGKASPPAAPVAATVAAPALVDPVAV
ncbi:protein Wiz [Genypterus blacodes]|uniref:protein Wiz n=1 Tax=Genypterus blacodes TaxID=154954 RepID=UPI003F773CB7